MSQAILFREIINTALGTGGPPFQRGWMEGYKAAYATVMARFTEAIGVERDRMLSGAIDDDPIGFTPHE